MKQSLVSFGMLSLLFASASSLQGQVGKPETKLDVKPLSAAPVAAAQATVAPPSTVAASVAPVTVVDEGIVKTLGSSFNRVVALTESTSTRAKNGDVPLCDGEFANRMNKITSMTVQVKGVWTDVKNKKGAIMRQCLQGLEFTVMKTPAGVPLVGELVWKGDVYVVKTDAGIEHRLEKASPGLAKLVGKKVILDARETAQKTDKIWTVVTYSLYP